MKSTDHFGTMSDDELLRRLATLVASSRSTEADLVAHIGEVDARRLYLRQATSSMFVYCTERLHLSEAEACLRIAAARASREHPVVLEMLADGRLHLSAIAKIAPHLTPQNEDELLRRATHRTKREIEELVAELAPRPDVPSSIRKLPAGRLVPAPLAERLVVPRAISERPIAELHRPGTELCRPVTERGQVGTEPGPTGTELRQPVTELRQPVAYLHQPASELPHSAAGPRPERVDSDGLDGVVVSGTVTADRAALAGEGGGASVESEPVSDGEPRPDREITWALARPRPAVIEALAPARYRVQFTASADLRDKLERLQALMRTSVPDGDLAKVIEAAVTEKLERLEARRFGRTSAPRESVATTDVTRRIRHVPAAVKRAVHARDEGRCRYVDAEGHRCTARVRVQLHHRIPWAVGGDDSPQNVSTLCSAHNRYLAEIDFGREAVGRQRRFTGGVPGSPMKLPTG